MFVDCVLYARHSSKSFIFNVLLNQVRTFGVGGFPRWLSGKQIYLSMQQVQETSVRTLARKIPWRRKWQPTPIFLPGEYHGLSSLGVTVQEVTKELDMAERLNIQAHGFLTGRSYFYAHTGAGNTEAWEVTELPKAVQLLCSRSRT